jgi:hypothetical protein
VRDGDQHRHRRSANSCDRSLAAQDRKLAESQTKFQAEFEAGEARFNAELEPGQIFAIAPYFDLARINLDSTTPAMMAPAITRIVVRSRFIDYPSSR